MPTYILLLTLSQEGREQMVDEPDTLLRATSSISIPEVQCLGMYGVLGDYDFVTILEAPDNESAARFSLELGAEAGVHIQTLPAVPIGLFEHHNDPSSTPADETLTYEN